MFLIENGYFVVRAWPKRHACACEDVRFPPCSSHRPAGRGRCPDGWFTARGHSRSPLTVEPDLSVWCSASRAVRAAGRVDRSAAVAPVPRLAGRTAIGRRRRASGLPARGRNTTRAALSDGRRLRPQRWDLMTAAPHPSVSSICQGRRSPAGPVGRAGAAGEAAVVLTLRTNEPSTHPTSCRPRRAIARTCARHRSSRLYDEAYAHRRDPRGRNPRGGARR